MNKSHHPPAVVSRGGRSASSPSFVRGTCLPAGRGLGWGRSLTTALLLFLASLAFLPVTTGCSGSPGTAADANLATSQKNTVYYIDDHLGSAQMLADSEGAVVYESLTAPFGIDLDGATLATTEAVENADYAYTTKERDRETGLVYFGKRFYSPSMGRWLTPDPKFRDDPQEVVQHPLEGNLYSYVRNSPMGYVDPTGFGAWAMTGGAYDVFSGVPDSWYRYGGGVLDLPANLLNGAINVVGSATSGVDTALGSAGTNLEEIGISMMMIPGAGAAVGGALKYASAWAGAQSSALASRMGNVLTGSGPGRVFWSGGVGARSAAESFAMTTGGQTLEMTRVGRLLDAVTTSKTYPYVKPLWNKASQMFARGAEGAVDVFQSSKGVRLESVWGTVEYPELMKQGATINYHLAP